MKYLINKKPEDVVAERYDILGFFDAKLTNPNGDPNNDNYPRVTDNGHGYMTDMAFKRKIRDFVENLIDEDGYRIFVSSEGTMEDKQKEAYDNAKIDKKKADKVKEEETQELIKYMCDNFFDIRAFGSVLNTTDYKMNKNMIGPVQVDYSESCDPVVLIDDSITRKGFLSEKEKNSKKEGTTGQMGSKKCIDYGLYKFSLTVNPVYAERTGFTYKDLEVLIDAISNLFYFRTASKNGLTVQKLWVLEHPDKLGYGQFGKIKECLVAKKFDDVDIPSYYCDYDIVDLDKSKLHNDIKVIDIL